MNVSPKQMDGLGRRQPCFEEVMMVCKAERHDRLNDCSATGEVAEINGKNKVEINKILRNTGIND